MGIKFFGQYLVEKKVITRDALEKAVALQRKRNLLFGETARSMGMITDADIERVREAQRKQDLDFGDMIVKLGILTQSQMKQVAEQQKKSRLRLGDALVMIDAVHADALPKLLAEFEADQARYWQPKPAPPAQGPNEELWDVCADLTYKMFARVANLAFKPGERIVADGIEPNDTVVAVRMTGDARCRYVLSVSRETRDIIARSILKQDDISSEPRVVLTDAVKEFANIVCGNIAAKASQIGKNVEIGPPEILDGRKRISPAPGEKAHLFPLLTDEGRVEAAIFRER